MGAALLFGFAAAMLGVSGFESSANFVEEQAQGVFPKTLRNMWIAITVLNPTIALLALALVPIDQVDTHHAALLSQMGLLAGGPWLSWIISVSAVATVGTHAGSVEVTRSVQVVGLAR